MGWVLRKYFQVRNVDILGMLLNCRSNILDYPTPGKILHPKWWKNFFCCDE